MRQLRNEIVFSPFLQHVNPIVRTLRPAVGEDWTKITIHVIISIITTVPTLDQFAAWWRIFLTARYNEKMLGDFCSFSCDYGPGRRRVCLVLHTHQSNRSDPRSADIFSQKASPGCTNSATTPPPQLWLPVPLRGSSEVSIHRGRCRPPLRGNICIASDFCGSLTRNLVIVLWTVLISMVEGRLYLTPIHYSHVLQWRQSPVIQTNRALILGVGEN